MLTIEGIHKLYKQDLVWGFRISKVQSFKDFYWMELLKQPSNPRLLATIKDCIRLYKVTDENGLYRLDLNQKQYRIHKRDVETLDKFKEAVNSLLMLKYSTTISK